MEHLDAGTRSKLRSTQILTSLPQIISELVQNSLDAGAKHVDVGVNYEEWGCWVRDDGVGISKDGLAVIAQGSEAGRYATSKTYTPSSLDNISTFGFRGEALASAADVACIEISSRTIRSKESWSIILKGGEKLYNGPSLRWRRDTPGTAVSIRDAFYNLPIRRLSHSSASRTIDAIRRDLESHALIFPLVAFSLEDIAKERKDGSGKGRIMTIPKTPSPLSAFRHLYGRALVEHVDEINVQLGAMKLEGFISLNGACSKSYQFLYVNRHLLSPCDLHRTIDQRFNASSFSKHAYDESGETRSPRPASRRSPRKGEKRPVYVLNLHIPPKEIDNCLEPAKAAVQFQNYDAVSSFMAVTVQAFLTRHGFSMTPQSKGNNDFTSQSPSPRKRRRVEQLINDRTPITSNASSTNDVTTDNEYNWPAIEPKVGSKHITIYEKSPMIEDAEMPWTDVVTGQTYMVDSRTGNSYVRGSRTEVPEDPPEREQGGSHQTTTRRAIVDTRWLRRCRNDGGGGIDDVSVPEMPEWMRKAMQGNKAYATTEPAIPVARPNFGSLANGQHQCQSEHTEDIFDSESYPSGWLVKDELATVEVIDQVDHKFIACLSQPPSECGGDEEDGNFPAGRTLFLIDQHAADERVRVERHLKGLCLGFLEQGGTGVKTKTLDPPVPVLLTSLEGSRLLESHAFRTAFKKWGFTICERPDTRVGLRDGYVQVDFTSIPDVVSRKLLAGDDLREVVKGYLARLESEGACQPDSELHPEIASDPFGWLKALRWCPRELVDLVNSRACRGAIMFNDPLAPDQCQRLVRELSETAFPFQCAHGRPSLVPIAQIGLLGGRVRRKIDWSKLDGG